MNNDPNGDLLDPSRLPKPTPIAIGPSGFGHRSGGDGWDDGGWDDDDDIGLGGSGLGDGGDGGSGGSGGFSSESEVQETVNYLFNSTAFGGHSSNFNTIAVFNNAQSELDYGYSQYTANGGTASFNGIIADYNTHNPGLPGLTSSTNNGYVTYGSFYHDNNGQPVVINGTSGSFMSMYLGQGQPTTTGNGAANQGGPRPDADGYLTLQEANDWYRNGNGQKLTVDINKLGLSNIYASDFDHVGSKMVVNLLLHSNDPNAGMVFGNITLKLYPGNIVKAYDDTYDFDMKSWANPLNWGRNIETVIGAGVAGQGTPYNIAIQGGAQVPAYRISGLLDN